MTDFTRRREAVRSRLAEVGADSFWIAHPANVRYLCGFTGSNGIGLLTADAFLLGTDGRYITQCAEECADVELVVDRDTVRGLAARAPGCVAIEADHVTVNQHAIIAERARTVPVSGWVEGVRIVKDAEEELLIRQACQISDEALESLLARIQVGMTEREIALRAWHLIPSWPGAHIQPSRIISPLIARWCRVTYSKLTLAPG